MCLYSSVQNFMKKYQLRAGGGGGGDFYVNLVYVLNTQIENIGRQNQPPK